MSTKGKLKSSLPHPDFWTYYAEGYERSPKLRQIPKNTGENDKNFNSGCGATAWATFIRWHDLLWTPELLLGSQDVSGKSWGHPDEPNYEAVYNSYNDRVIMELSDVLQTHGVSPDDGGSVHHNDMNKGFDYIEDLGHETSSRTYWKSHSTSVQKAYDYLSKKERPIVISTPGHYCVLEGFCHNLNSDKLDKQWLYINTGWSSPAKGYLKAKHLKKMWYTSHIRPRSQYTYNQIIGNKGVELCTTRLSATSQKPNNLWAFWLSQDGKINYVRSANLEFPVPNSIFPIPNSIFPAPNSTSYGPLNLATKVTLNVTSIYPPSTCADDNAIYLVYVDTNKKIHLMQYLLWKEDPELPEADRWKELSFPDIVTEVRPAITGGSGNWLTIAFCDNENGVQKIATNKDVARPNAWPEGIHIEGEIDTNAQSSWFPIYGLDWQTDYGLGIARFKDNTIVSWVSWVSGSNKICFWCSEPGGLGSQWVVYKWLFPDSAPSLVVFNNTLFLACAKSTWLAHRGDYYNRIFVYNLKISPPRLDPMRRALEPLNEGYWYSPGRVDVYESSRLTETCVGDPCIGLFRSSVELGWLDDNNKLTVRRISIDTAREPINYAGSP